MAKSEHVMPVFEYCLLLRKYLWSFFKQFFLLNHDLWFCVALYIHTARYSAETFVHLGVGKNNQVRNMKGVLCDFVWTENL